MAQVSINVKHHKPSILLYDSANVLALPGGPTVGADANTSIVSRYPASITVDGVPAGTVATIQVKLNEQETTWHDLGTVDGSVDANGIVIMDVPFNFARVVRTSGAGDYLVFDQRA